MDLIPFKDYLSINLSPKTALDYCRQMESFFRQYQEFNQENLNKYLASKVGAWSAGTNNQFFKSALWYMKFTKIILELPKLKRVERKPRPYLQEKEVEEILLKTPIIFRNSRKMRIVFELLFRSGMRPKELLTLQRKNIDLENLKILLVNTKTSFSRTVFIPSELASNIKTYFYQEVEKDNAFNLKPSALEYHFKILSKHLNTKITPYMCRHTFSQEFLKRTGKDIVALSKMLGHTSLETTKIYCDIDEQELQKIYNQSFNKKGKK